MSNNDLLTQAELDQYKLQPYALNQIENFRIKTFQNTKKELIFIFNKSIF